MGLYINEAEILRNCDGIDKPFRAIANKEFRRWKTCWKNRIFTEN